MMRGHRSGRNRKGSANECFETPVGSPAARTPVGSPAARKRMTQARGSPAVSPSTMASSSERVETNFRDWMTDVIHFGDLNLNDIDKYPNVPTVCQAVDGIARTEPNSNRQPEHVNHGTCAYVAWLQSHTPFFLGPQFCEMFGDAYSLEGAQGSQKSLLHYEVRQILFKNMRSVLGDAGAKFSVVDRYVRKSLAKHGIQQGSEMLHFFNGEKFLSKTSAIEKAVHKTQNIWTWEQTTPQTVVKRAKQFNFGFKKSGFTISAELICNWRAFIGAVEVPLDPSHGHAMAFKSMYRADDGKFIIDFKNPYGDSRNPNPQFVCDPSTHTCQSVQPIKCTQTGEIAHEELNHVFITKRVTHGSHFWSIKRSMKNEDAYAKNESKVYLASQRAILSWCFGVAFRWHNELKGLVRDAAQKQSGANKKHALSSGERNRLAPPDENGKASASSVVALSYVARKQFCSDVPDTSGLLILRDWSKHDVRRMDKALENMFRAIPFEVKPDDVKQRRNSKSDRRNSEPIAARRNSEQRRSSKSDGRNSEPKKFIYGKSFNAISNFIETRLEPLATHIAHNVTFLKALERYLHLAANLYVDVAFHDRNAELAIRQYSDIFPNEDGTYALHLADLEPHIVDTKSNESPDPPKKPKRVGCLCRRIFGGRKTTKGAAKNETIHVPMDQEVFPTSPSPSSWRP